MKQEKMDKTVFPVIPLRGLTVLPGEILHCDIGRRKSLSAMEQAITEDGYALFVAQKDPKAVEISARDLNEFGTVCRIRQVFRIQGETVHLLVTGVARAEILSFVEDQPYFVANVFFPEEIYPDDSTAEALRRRLTDGFHAHAAKKDRLTQEQQAAVLEEKDFSRFTDGIAQHVAGKAEDKQRILEETDVAQRALDLLAMIENELLILQVDQEIAGKVRAAVERNQKEFVLREQLKAVQKELGGGEEEQLNEYQERARNKTLPEEARKVLEKQIERYSQLPQGSHEAPMTQAYIELILDLPWTERSEDNLNLEHAREVLDRDHYGMEKVKERILEALAVQQLTSNPQGQIFCLVGPPGVGKTSIARAIAEAMGRKFVRMSLGGVHDEAEIRGHRRTYIGAQPGRIIEAMKKAGTVNPLLLFDEIDKLSNDLRGDPASAMLEVLDSAQNNTFSDHFLEIPYDLSQCVLMTTANDVSTIPRPLLDRMELIEVPSYLLTEKMEIAKRHLLPRQMERNGIRKSKLKVPDSVMELLIDGYTREAGVRELERVLGSVCRKAACEIVEGRSRITLSEKKTVSWFGPRKYHKQEELRRETVGVVTGLAWTSVGGETLEVEASAIPGKGNFQLTGQLGNVMQESAKAAMTYVRANAERLGIASDFLEKLDLHIHVPEGAVPKDGPSAGIAMCTALVSCLTGIPVRSDTAMTGEITLRGRVLPIGGLREKLLAAVRAGVKRVILPEDNRDSLYDVPDAVKQELQILFVRDVDRVIREAMTRMPAPRTPIVGQGADAGVEYGSICH